jgi:hypothetical protein
MSMAGNASSLYLLFYFHKTWGQGYLLVLVVGGWV